MAQGFWTPPTYGDGPVSLGSLDAMRAEQLAQGAAQATRTQASQLINARLASMASGQGNVDFGAIPQGEVGMTPGQFRASLFPRALEAGPQPLAPMYGPGIPVNSAGVVNPSTGAVAGPVSAAEQLAGEAAPAAEGAAAGGLMARLGQFTGLSPAARAAGVAEGAAVPGLLGTLAGRVGPALAYAAPAEALGMATKYVGPSLVQALGLHVAPGALAAGASAGSDVGTGAALGTLVAPGPGTLIGAGVGGLKALGGVAPEFLSNLAGGGVADQWKAAVNQFDKTIMGYKKSNVGQTGQDYVNTTYLPAGQKIMDAARAGQMSHTDAINALTQLNTGMATDFSTAKQQYKSAQTAKNGSPSDQRLAIQMGQAMGQLAQTYITQAQGASDMERQQAAAQPALAPVLNADAASREAYAKQMGAAFQGAAYITPTINKMDAQIAYNQQLLAQIRAAQISAAASAGGSGSLASLTNPSAQNAQAAQQQANGVLNPQAQLQMQQAYAMAQLGQ